MQTSIGTLADHKQTDDTLAGQEGWRRIQYDVNCHLLHYEALKSSSAWIASYCTVLYRNRSHLDPYNGECTSKGIHARKQDHIQQCYCQCGARLSTGTLVDSGACVAV